MEIDISSETDDLMVPSLLQLIQLFWNMSYLCFYFSIDVNVRDHVQELLLVNFLRLKLHQISILSLESDKRGVLFQGLCELFNDFFLLLEAHLSFDTHHSSFLLVVIVAKLPR